MAVLLCCALGAGNAAAQPSRGLQLGISTAPDDFGLAPGTYPLNAVGFGSRGGNAFSPSTVMVLPPLQQALAELQRYQRMSFPGGVDSVGAADPLVGTADWYGDLLNETSPAAVMPGAAIAVSSATAQFQPTVTFPVSVGPQDLARFDVLDLPLTGATGIHFTSGYDVSRSATPANWTLPAVGGRETVTLAFTPTQNVDSALLQVIPDWSNGPTGVIDASAVTVGAGPGEIQYEDIEGGIAIVQVSAQAGHTYTLTVPIDVSTGGVYKPLVSVNTNNFASTDVPSGPSATLSDSLLGGSFVFSAATDVQWSLERIEGNTVSFAPMLPTELSQLQGLRAQLDGLLAGASRSDAAKIHVASAALGAATAAALWSADGNALDSRRGAAVFADLAIAAQTVSSVSSARPIVTGLVASARRLARHALDATASRLGETSFARGDGASSPAAAIALYGVAWALATH